MSGLTTVRSLDRRRVLVRALVVAHRAAVNRHDRFAHRAVEVGPATLEEAEQEREGKERTSQTPTEMRGERANPTGRRESEHRMERTFSNHGTPIAYHHHIGTPFLGLGGRDRPADYGAISAVKI